MKKNNYKFLNIQGIVLDKEQLQEYMRKIATNHNLQRNSSALTYPIPRLKDNFNFIYRTYKLLNSHIKINIDIYPAGEWLLDNFYIIEETVKTVIKEITAKRYKNFQGILNGTYKGYARIYALAAEIVAYTDNKITEDTLKLSLSAYQSRKTLNMEEIWSLYIFLQIAIIENIRAICEKIYFSQTQKYKVEGILERLVEKKNIKEQTYKQNNEKYGIKFSYKELKYPFIEYMSYKLKKYGKKGLAYLNILEEQVNKMGMTISEAIKKEHFDIAIRKSKHGK